MTGKNCQIYFSHLKGENFLIHSKDEHQKAVLKNPKIPMMLLDGEKVTFYNDSLGDREFIINNTDGKIIVVDASRKDLLIGCYGKKVIGVNVTSPPLLSNYPFWKAGVELESGVYILPNGKIFEDHRRVSAWIKKFGKDRLEFNMNSYIEASKLAKFTQKGIIKVIKKPKGKSDNPFFDPKAMQSHVKGGESAVIRQKSNFLVKSSVKDDILACNSCKFFEKCPKFQANSICAYSKRFKELAPLVGTRDLDLLGESLQKIMQTESKRYLRGTVMEEVSGDLDPAVTNIGDGLFKKVVDFMKIMKPILNTATQYNILNQNVNIAVSMEKLENAGLTEDQRTNLAEEIEGIIKEQKRKTTS
jgi:hypothetical protein